MTITADGQLARFLDLVAHSRVESLARPELGPLSFEGLTQPLESIRRLLEEAIPQETEIPAQRLNSAVQLLNQLQSLEQQIEAFDINSSNPANTRDSLVTQVVNIRDQLVDQVRPVLRGDSAVILERLAETEGALSESQAMNERLSDLLQRTRQGQIEVAGETASSFFEQQAKEHSEAANRFLGATVVFAVILALLAGVEWYVFVQWPSSYATWGEALAASIPRLTLLAILSFAIGFSARNYRVNSHLRVLNLTKAVTIKAADRYAAAVEQSEHRDLVVASLVQAVFAIGDTGFLPVDSERTIIESPGAGAFLAAAASPKSG